MSESLEKAASQLWEEAKSLLCDWQVMMFYGAFPNPKGIPPLFAESGKGCRLYDSTGRCYVDWAPGWGSQVLGYRHPLVERAIAKQLEKGTHFSLMTQLEVEVARALVEIVPCAERVAFGKNGSDGLLIAVRIARAVTGREMILTCGYHGFHDWFLAREQCEGIPQALRDLVRGFSHNDLPSVEDLFQQHAGEIAAIVIDPAASAVPEPGFLEGIRELANEHGTLLVYDEVITSFRLARGGAQEAFGVIPDMACLGKAMSNGMPLSACVGRAEIMNMLPRIGYGPTYRGEALSLAAARACLEVHCQEPVAQRLAEIGEQLRERFNESLHGLGISGRLCGPPARMAADYELAGGFSQLGMRMVLIEQLLAHGVLTTGNFLPSYAHDEEAVELTGQAFRKAHETLEAAVEERDLLKYITAPPNPLLFEDGCVPSRYSTE